MRTAQKAFTLIELLIVISLITIVTGALLPSFNSYIDAQNVKQSQEMVKDQLRNAQNKALNGESASIVLGDGQVAYWGIEFVPGSSTFDLFISTSTNACGGGASPEDNRRIMSTSSKLPGNTVIIAPAAVGCAFFSFENGDAIFASGGNIIIVGPADASSGNTVCREVNVNSAGLISASDNYACP